MVILALNRLIKDKALTGHYKIFCWMPKLDAEFSQNISEKIFENRKKWSISRGSSDRKTVQNHVFGFYAYAKKYIGHFSVNK